MKIVIKNVSCEFKCKFIVESVIEIKIGISIKVDASAENIAYVKKIIFWILLHVVEKMLNI